MTLIKIDKDEIIIAVNSRFALDTELFSASSWLEGYYLLALKAASVMADYLGETEQADEYRALYANGK